MRFGHGRCCWLVDVRRRHSVAHSALCLVRSAPTVLPASPRCCEVGDGSSFGSAACSRLCSGWDEIVDAFLDGGPAAPARLKAWANSYQGRGRGSVVWEAFAEPFLGRLDQRPAGVVLALNPGIAHLDFQGRSGVFADEIRAMGSYTVGAASWPYLRDSWVVVKGRNRHHV